MFLFSFWSHTFIIIIFYTSTALRIHLSPECKAALDLLGGFQMEERGPVTMKVSYRPN